MTQIVWAGEIGAHFVRSAHRLASRARAHRSTLNRRGRAEAQRRGFRPGVAVSRQEENPPRARGVDFYKHKHNWTNRLIAGDSLLVMNSLLEKEGMAGKVQMVYIDPPYGIDYASNFQPFTNNRT